MCLCWGLATVYCCSVRHSNGCRTVSTWKHFMACIAKRFLRISCTLGYWASELQFYCFMKVNRKLVSKHSEWEYYLSSYCNVQSKLVAHEQLLGASVSDLNAQYLFLWWYVSSSFPKSNGVQAVCDALIFILITKGGERFWRYLLYLLEQYEMTNEKEEADILATASLRMITWRAAMLFSTSFEDPKLNRFVGCSITVLIK